MTGPGALGAGFLIVATAAALAAIGVFLGSLVDLRLAGGLLGGAIGVVLGFVLVWRMYVLPANAEDDARDYSKVRPVEDDDDDAAW